MSGGDSLPPLRDVVSKYGIAPQKALGQNFLFDLNLTRKIARAAGPLAGVTVVEVGPGPGGLTRALLAEGAAKVLAVERDPRCLEALEDIARAWPGRLEIVAGDALTTDFAALAKPHLISGPVRLAANLPYNIGTPLLAGWLGQAAWPPWYDKMVLMFQREVAERIVATPRQRADYGRLGVLCGWRSQARILFDVPPEAFTPPPKVISSVVELAPRQNPAPCDLGRLEAVTQAAFGQRRKMLRQSLKALGGQFAGLDVMALLESCGISPTMRAEEVEVAGFVALANGVGAQSRERLLCSP